MQHDETHFLEGNQLQMNCELLDRKIFEGVSTFFAHGTRRLLHHPPRAAGRPLYAG
jgi:hypothetical protein